MIKISIGWCGKLQGTEANVIEGFIVNAEGFICVFYQLMNGQCGVVRFYHCVGYLGGWYYAEGIHNTVWVFFTNLADEKGSHTRTGSATKGMCQLKALQEDEKDE